MAWSNAQRISDGASIEWLSIIREASGMFPTIIPVSSSPVSREFSLYLDLVRILAAAVVLYSHANLRALSERILPGESLGHSAVVVFFVLSGYVIAFVTDTRERSGRDYAISRFARIYSVALPALIVTMFADLVGQPSRRRCMPDRRRVTSGCFVWPPASY